MTTKKSAARTAKKATKKSTKKSAKTTAKKAVKKSSKKTSKKSSKKASAKKPTIHYAEGPACFWVHEGPVLTSLIDLEAAFRGMDEQLYRYHASGSRNDFAEWVESVLSDTTCANALRKARKPSSAATVVRKRLSVYEY